MALVLFTQLNTEPDLQSVHSFYKRWHGNINGCEHFLQLVRIWVDQILNRKTQLRGLWLSATNSWSEVDDQQETAGSGFCLLMTDFDRWKSWKWLHWFYRHLIGQWKTNHTKHQTFIWPVKNLSNVMLVWRSQAASLRTKTFSFILPEVALYNSPIQFLYFYVYIFFNLMCVVYFGVWHLEWKRPQ